MGSNERKERYMFHLVCMFQFPLHFPNSYSFLLPDHMSCELRSAPDSQKTAEPSLFHQLLPQKYKVKSVLKFPSCRERVTDALRGQGHLKGQNENYPSHRGGLLPVF